MTTTTLAPVEVEDLEAWLRGEVEKRCEIFSYADGQCEQEAHWLLFGRCPAGCWLPGSRFACEYDKALAEAGEIFCRYCPELVVLTFIERIR
jgi:hypothetical protein